MSKDTKEYFKVLKGLFDKIIATDVSSRVLEFDKALDRAIQMIIKQATSGGKLMFIGNGASAAISSHMAVDFWKNAGIKAISFNDSSLLTCVSNDYGYKYVFEKPIEMFAKTGDCLIAVSSSGESENILRGTYAAKKKKAKILTLSGFAKSNALRKLGEINFYVPSVSYGYVETMHQAICHCLVDLIIKKKNG